MAQASDAVVLLALVALAARPSQCNARMGEGARSCEAVHLPARDALALVGRREAKVGEFDVAAAREEDVGRLDVAMADALGV